MRAQCAATQDPNHRILARHKSRFTHYYFYIRDEVLGPMAMRVGRLDVPDLIVVSNGDNVQLLVDCGLHYRLRRHGYVLYVMRSTERMNV